MIKKYLKYFDKGRIERGEELYNDDQVKNAIKHNNVYYFKVSGNYKNHYNVKIEIKCNDNVNFNCNCEDSAYCKHIFASLLYLENKNCDVLNLNNLTQIELEEILNHLIKKDSSILWTILKYQKINKKENIKNNSIEKFELFFEDFEIEDYEQLIDHDNYDYEYCDDIYEKYDDELINLLKKYSDENVIKYVEKKINKYNNYLDDIGFSVFEKTQKYISDSNNYVGNDDIIKLFKTNYKKAECELEKITKSNDAYYILSKIKLDKKNTSLLLKKIDYYVSKNELDIYVYDMVRLLIFNTKDTQIIKKYGLMLLEYNHSYDIYKKIKSFCSMEEMEKICENMLKVYNMNNDIFNILYDLKKYDDICEILSKNNLQNIENINNFFGIIIKNKPDKIIDLIKNNISYILDNKRSNYYSGVIEYLVVLKNNTELNSFTNYTNELLILHSSKKKFKQLYKEVFIQLEK